MKTACMALAFLTALPAWANPEWVRAKGGDQRHRASQVKRPWPWAVLLLTLTLLLTLACGAARAAPMGFKDSFMTMLDVSAGAREASVNYALTARDAVGVAGLRVRSFDKRLTRDAALVSYTRLLQRWNMPDAQANIWFLGALGSVKGKEFTSASTLAAPALQVDYETTRLYGSVAGRLFRARDINHDSATLRTGFSFYEADYDEVQPWLIVEVRRSRGLTDKVEVTPMLRLIHKRFFLELGVSDSSQARASLMVTY